MRWEKHDTHIQSYRVSANARIGARRKLVADDGKIIGWATLRRLDNGDTRWVTTTTCLDLVGKYKSLNAAAQALARVTAENGGSA